MERYGSINSIRNNQIFIEKARLLSIDGEGRKKKQGQNVLYLQKIHHNDEIEKCYRQTDWIPYLLTDTGLLVLAVLVRFY